MERKDRNVTFLTILSSQQQLAQPTKRFMFFILVISSHYIYLYGAIWHCNAKLETIKSLRCAGKTAFWPENCAELVIKILLKYILGT